MSVIKILIANRGEIACRIIRTARALGYRTVAVYSEADAQAPHVAMADEALCIGPAAAAQSYLDSERMLAAARRTGADAVHPGYGFLSERADFAQAVVNAGLVFIGPPSASIEAMGSKSGAKRLMLAAGVPCVPGYLGESQDEGTLQHEAEKLGFPLLVKAVAGGGGRGMRLVHHAADLPQALISARREAAASFGDGTLMLEQLIAHGRHIEIQIFADRHGHAVHLGERDCTAQRRRQKVIEEAPSPVVSPAMRERMGADAVAAALAVGYVGAGTVEFIVDEDFNHYFLEMNTRLQVEHPVTECITGLDLVEWQLRVACGEVLPLTQDQVQFRGHAIEARLYAEDPWHGFTPQSGPIDYWRPGLALTPGVRIDDGIVEGGEVSPYYDAMVAKIIVTGRDRDDAIRRLAAALEDAPLMGVINNGRFLRDLIRHEDFRAARLHTRLLDDWAEQGAPLLLPPQPSETDWLLAAGLRVHASRVAGPGGPPFEMSLQHESQTRRYHGHLRPAGIYLTAVGGDPADIHLFEILGQDSHGRQRVRLDGVQRYVACHVTPDRAGVPGRLQLASDGAVFSFVEPSATPAGHAAADPLRANSPVTGVVAQVLVQVGDLVADGQALLSVEAMKMEMWLNAGAAGQVKAIHATAGEAVAAGTLLLELEASPKAAA